MTTKSETLEFDIGGVRTVVRTLGDGKPVIFLHGASTLEGFDAVDALADEFRLLYPSHPGMGHSGNASHIADMSDMLVHYLELLDQLQLPEKPHLIGFSMGGWMATELAAIARERFDHVVLIAPAGLNHPDHPASDLSKIAPEDLPRYLAHREEVALHYFPSQSDPGQAAVFGAARQREAQTVNRLLAPFGMGHPNLPRFMARITNPTLVVWGLEDRLLPASQAQIWADILPNAQQLLIPDAGHLVAQEQPITVQHIREFFQQ